MAKNPESSDWDDEDLLTVAAAAERIAEEIRRARDRGDRDREQELIAAAERITRFTDRPSQRVGEGQS